MPDEMDERAEQIVSLLKDKHGVHFDTDIQETHVKKDIATKLRTVEAVTEQRVWEATAQALEATPYNRKLLGRIATEFRRRARGTP